MHSLIYPSPPQKKKKTENKQSKKKKQKQKQKSDYDKFRKLTNKIPLIPFLVNSETGGLQLFFTDNFLEKLARTANLLLHALLFKRFCRLFEPLSRILL